VLVLGLGNPLLGDDGVGWRVVDRLEATLDGRSASRRLPAFELDRLARGGLELMERMTGYDRVILVDAVVSDRDAPGAVRCAPLADAGTRPGTHLDSAHDAPLPVALAAGRYLGARLPEDITLVAIGARAVDTFDAALSPAVAAAVPRAVAVVVDLLLRTDA
jgi:hydrogenase maturation protease